MRERIGVTSRRSRGSWLAAAMATAGLIGGFGASEATAHGSAIEAVPAPGSVVATLDQIQLRFDEPLLPDPPPTIQLHRIGVGLLPVTSVEVVDGSLLRGTPPARLGAGEYQLAYSVSFADATFTNDAYPFTVVDPAAGSRTLVIASGLAAILVIGWILIARARARRSAESP